MALRRFAQENNAASPRSPERPNESAPQSPMNGVPSTPRSRLSYGFHRSPADTPSISSSVPFDWDAARSRGPAPYATPLKPKGRKSVGTGTPAPRKAIIRRKGLIERQVWLMSVRLYTHKKSRIQNIPSWIAFEYALFPQNVPLPTPKVSARIVGGTIHFIHFCLLASHDHDDGWESLSGVKNTSWFDWVRPACHSPLRVLTLSSFK